MHKKLEPRSQAKKSLHRPVLATLGVAALVGGAPAAASADPWGDTPANPIAGTGTHPDGGAETYCYGTSLPSHLEDNVVVAMNAVGASQADITIHVDCDLSGQFRTDILFEEDDFATNNVLGSSGCDRWNQADTRCDQGHATIDIDEVRERADDDASDNLTRAVAYNWVFCHEAGHNVGLTHYNKNPGSGQQGQADCMRSEMDGLIGNTTVNMSTFQKYSSHHISHLNDWF